MNCEDFIQIIDELADYRPVSATLRDASVSHAALCSGCAARLADARAAGNGLLLAARAESEAAPGKVKENLLAAFAQFHETRLNETKSDETKAVGATVVDISSRRGNIRRWTTAAAAIAAVILLAAIVSIWKNTSEIGPIQYGAPGHGSLAIVPDAAASPEIVSPTPSPSVSPVNDKPLVDKSQTARNTAPAANRSRRSRPVAPQSESQTQTSASVAQTREYLPLTYLAKGTTIESGTVIRVELSRAALASLGVTSGVDGTGESVTAEVILGDDGVARAIRLID